MPSTIVRTVNPAVISKTLTGRVGNLTVKSPPGVTSSIPMEEQKRNFHVAISDYSSPAATLGRPSQSPSRSQWAKAYRDQRALTFQQGHVDYTEYLRHDYKGHKEVVQFLKERAGTERAERIIDKAKRGHTATEFSDEDITFIAQALDDARPYGEYERFDLNATYLKGGAWNGAVTAKWVTLRDGIDPLKPYPNPADPNLDLQQVQVTWGFKGLYWYCMAVPATMLIARLRVGSPEYQPALDWIERLAPLTDITQSDLENAAQTVSFSNPRVGSSSGFGKVIDVFRSVTAAPGIDANGHPTGDGATGGGVVGGAGAEVGLPWGTIIILLAIAGAAYYFLIRRKGS